MFRLRLSRFSSCVCVGFPTLSRRNIFIYIGMLVTKRRRTKVLCLERKGKRLICIRDPSSTERRSGFEVCVKHLSNVWTRKKCRTCDERIPSWLFGFHKQVSEEQQFVRYESSSSDESIFTVATQYRIAAERDRRQKELEDLVAKLEAELKVAAASSGVHVERNEGGTGT